MVNVKIGCLNCRGLASDHVKRRDIFERCRRKYDITLLVDTHSSTEVEKCWANEWGYKAYFNSYTSNSRGVAVLLKNSFEFEVLNVLKDNSGNFLILNISYFNMKHSLTVLYGPNEDSPEFFENISKQLETLGNDSVIIGGDFNVPLDYSSDTKSYRNNNNQKARERVLEMISEHDLVDVWRENNPSLSRFTWHGPHGKQARLDYFLISTSLQVFTVNADIGYAYRSDHSPVEISFKYVEQSRGRGSWKFNNSLLYDKEYVQLIKQCISETLAVYEMCTDNDVIHYSINDQLLWETLKMAIRGKTISYASHKKRENEKQEKLLENQLLTLHNGNCDIDRREDIEKIENELRNIRNKKIQGIILRAKARWNVEGERSTNFFCNLEKRNYIEKMITKLIDEDKEYTNIEDIMNIQKKFYETLYTSHDCKIQDNHLRDFFNRNNPYLNFLDTEESESLEGLISKSECLAALRNMKNGKSPGLDGYTAEFYKFFWSDLHPFLLNSLNYAYHTGSFSITQRQGVITCLPKDGKPKEYIKNWRPISLLNVDYKIASSSLANRMKNVLDKLISETQTGFLKGRYIGENTRFLYDLVERLNKENLPGILVLVDFEKAFDSLEWNFISKTLDFFGFGSSFVKWFKTLYSDISSSVLNNGDFTDFFRISRGVRQGDPLSPYIFILAVELLSASIKFNPNIKGIKLNDAEYLISQYADDSALTLADDLDSLNSTLDCLESFAHCSGLRTNFNKTQAIWIGVKRGCGEEYKTNQNLLWNHEGKFKLLGIIYDLKKDDFTEDNFKEKLQSMKNLLHDWAFRNLTIMGKVTVIKTLALPILVHCLSVLPDPKIKLFDEIQKHIFKFIWNNKNDKIKRNIMMNNKDNGGLKVPHIHSFAKSLKLTWIKKSLNPNCKALWKTLLSDKLEKWGYSNIWQLRKEGLLIASKEFNSFWCNTMNAWGEIIQHPTTAPLEILRQPLWLNNDILINKQRICKTSWIKKGVFFIDDLIDAQGNFLSLTNFQEKFELQTNFLTYNGIISAIPRGWRELIKNFPKDEIRDSYIAKIKNTTKVSKNFYPLFMSSVVETPWKVKQKWEEKLSIQFDENELEYYFVIPHHVTMNTKLITFQFQILHQILPTNSKLFLFKLLDTELCSFCHETKETIVHLFYVCQHVRNIWIILKQKLRELCGVDVCFNEQIVIFGYNDKSENYRAINLLILLAKRFIYINRCQYSIPNMKSLFEYIKCFRCIDIYSSHSLGFRKETEIKESWQIISKIL